VRLARPPRVPECGGGAQPKGAVRGQLRAARLTRPGPTDRTYLIIDGILQTAGLTMLILGLAVGETVTVYGRADGTEIQLGADPAD